MWLVWCKYCQGNTTPAKPPKHRKFQKQVECSVCNHLINARVGVHRSLPRRPNREKPVDLLAIG